ncbi:hypothetical protein HGRIS_014508 [Hohenbuehelia grisea]|uniref:Uncharacterized protein n=1 Tax=Hohenbuehelia grisea TaxID=104357 RepID=A0ABR3JTW6_9AGAR
MSINTPSSESSSLSQDVLSSLSEPTSDERPDLGAFTTVMREMSYLQPPLSHRVHRTIGQLGQNAISTEHSVSTLPSATESTQGEHSTVWAQRRIASYLSPNTPILSESDIRNEDAMPIPPPPTHPHPTPRSRPLLREDSYEGSSRESGYRQGDYANDSNSYSSLSPDSFRLHTTLPHDPSSFPLNRQPDATLRPHSLSYITQPRHGPYLESASQTQSYSQSQYDSTQSQLISQIHPFPDSHTVPLTSNHSSLSYRLLRDIRSDSNSGSDTEGEARAVEIHDSLSITSLSSAASRSRSRSIDHSAAEEENDLTNNIQTTSSPSSVRDPDSLGVVARKPVPVARSASADLADRSLNSADTNSSVCHPVFPSGTHLPPLHDQPSARPQREPLAGRVPQAQSVSLSMVTGSSDVDGGKSSPEHRSTSISSLVLNSSTSNLSAAQSLDASAASGDHADSDMPIYDPDREDEHQQDFLDESDDSDSDHDDSNSGTNSEDDDDDYNLAPHVYAYRYPDHTRSMPDLTRSAVPDDADEEADASVAVGADVPLAEQLLAGDSETPSEGLWPSLGYLDGALDFLKAERERLRAMGAGHVTRLLKGDEKVERSRGSRSDVSEVNDGTKGRTRRRKRSSKKEGREEDTPDGAGEVLEVDKGSAALGGTGAEVDDRWERILEPRRKRKRKRGTAGNAMDNTGGLASSRTSTISAATVTSRAHGLTIESGIIPPHTLSDGERPASPLRTPGPSKIKGLSVIPMMPSMLSGTTSFLARSRKPSGPREPVDKRNGLSENDEDAYVLTADNKAGVASIGSKGKSRARTRTRTRTKTAPGDTSSATASVAAQSPKVTSLKPPTSPFSDLSSLNFSIALPSFATALSPTIPGGTSSGGLSSPIRRREKEALVLSGDVAGGSGKRRQRKGRRKDGGGEVSVLDMDDEAGDSGGMTRSEPASNRSVPIDIKRPFVQPSDADADESALSSAIGSLSERPSFVSRMFARHMRDPQRALSDADGDDGIGDEEDEVEEVSTDDGFYSTKKGTLKAKRAVREALPSRQVFDDRSSSTAYRDRHLKRFSFPAIKVDDHEADSTGYASATGYTSGNEPQSWQQQLLARRSRSRNDSRNRNSESRQGSHSRGGSGHSHTHSSTDPYNTNYRPPSSTSRPYSSDIPLTGSSGEPSTARNFHYPSLPIQDNEEHEEVGEDAQGQQKSERRRRRRSRNRNNAQGQTPEASFQPHPVDALQRRLIHARSSPVLRAAAPTPGTAMGGGFKDDSDHWNTVVALVDKEQLGSSDSRYGIRRRPEAANPRLRQLWKMADKLKTLFPEDSSSLSLIDALAGSKRNDPPTKQIKKATLSRSMSARVPRGRGKFRNVQGETVQSDDDMDARHRRRVVDEGDDDEDDVGQEEAQELIGSWVDVRGRPAQDGDPLIHVFVDHSNILVGMLTYFNKHPHILRNAYKSVPRVVNAPGAHQKMKRYLSHSALALLLERGRPVTKRVLAASSPLYQPIADAEALGYEARVFKRVPHDEQDLSALGNADATDNARFKAKGHRRKASGNISTESEYAQGVSSGSGPHVFARNLNSGIGTSPSKPSFAHHASSPLPVAASTPPRVRYREQGVDELLQLKLHQALAATDGAPSPDSTIVLATGDGNPGQFNEEGFLGAVRTALRKGWRVELYAWSDGLSSAWSREFGGRGGKGKKALSRSDEDASGGLNGNGKGYGDRFKIIPMDQFSTELIEFGPAEWS